MSFIVFTGKELFTYLMKDAAERTDTLVTGMVPELKGAALTFHSFFRRRIFNKNGIFFLRSFLKNTARFAEDEIIKAKEKGNNDITLLFSNAAMLYFEPSSVLMWRKRYGVKTALYFLDGCDSFYGRDAHDAVKAGCFDRVFTFSKDDAERYGFEYNDCYFSIPYIRDEPDIGKNDGVFFWGSDGGRRKKAEALFKNLSEKGIKVKMGICYTQGDGERIPGITYDKPMEYEDMIAAEAGSAVIADITGSYSTGVSLRYYEAVVLGKKLLTDNKRVKDMRLYTPEQIICVDDMHDISGEITEKLMAPFTPVSYNGEFSPVHLLDRLM
ncbi:MAG: hypothetical protein K5987_05110 [Lachnospiraceae bacterium]|nr:hypothetical protein [Lachnospiraceae bacterium]